MKAEMCVVKKTNMTDEPTFPSRLTGFAPQSNISQDSPVKKILLSAWSYRMVRVMLAAVFLWSGTAKLIHPEDFAAIIEAFGLIPASWLMPSAVLLPVIEVAAALGLLTGVRGSLRLIFGLLVLFTLILTHGIWLGLDIDCGCFGPEDIEGQVFHGLRPALYRNLALMGGVGYLYIRRWLRQAASQKPHTGSARK